jgi:hypothetical protein
MSPFFLLVVKVVQQRAVVLASRVVILIYQSHFDIIENLILFISNIQVCVVQLIDVFLFLKHF